MTALAESSPSTSIHNVFSWPISTFLRFSQVGKPVLDKCLNSVSLLRTSPFTMVIPQFQPLFQTLLLRTDPHRPSIGLPFLHTSGSQDEILEGGILLCPITLM